MKKQCETGLYLRKVVRLMAEQDTEPTSDRYYNISWSNWTEHCNNCSDCYEAIQGKPLSERIKV